MHGMFYLIGALVGAASSEPLRFHLVRRDTSTLIAPGDQSLKSN